MEKSYLLGKSPPIIIVEGFWGVGKSTLIERVLEKQKARLIQEPRHKNEKVTNNVSNWYRRQHSKRLELANKYAKRGDKVVLERSMLSSIAFQYAKHGKLPPWSREEIKKLYEFSNLKIVFIFNDKKNQDFENNIRDKSVLDVLRNNDAFYERYKYFYLSILPARFQIKVIGINILNRRTNLLEKAEFELSRMLSHDIPVLPQVKRIKKEFCASAIISYKNKFLVLYSQDYKFYVFPQGHLLEGENYREAAMRETIEETGFYDLKMIAQVGKYDYRYSEGDITIHKYIVVYLLKLNTLSKQRKGLEPHEHYLNYFFTSDEAFRKLRWPQDIRMLQRAEKILDKAK